MPTRHTTTWFALIISSLLFGLSHVRPSLHLAKANRDRRLPSARRAYGR